jgi:succinate-semialdehyde dehydrogenase/glutarate-semialdehyde dehydrogenase
MKLSDPKLFRQQCYVDGEWVDALNRGTIPVTDPATGETLGTVPRMGAEETRQAIEAADRALPAWRAKTAKERAHILRRWYDLMMANQDDLATLMTAEQGKPLAESKGEIAYAASFIEWFGEEGKRIYGDTIPAHMADKRIVVTKEPIGTMVLKPASATPFSALALCKLAERAGVPRGVFSCVTGGANEIGGEMTSNPIVRKLTFTGSTEIGKLLMEQCAATVKKTSMELGGNAPFIVFDDADIEMAVKGAIASKYRNAGQTCVCANRILVQDGVYDAFTKRLAETAGAMKVASGFEPGAVIGPLIDMKAVEKVEAHIADAVRKGAKIVTGGRRAAQGGSFFEPTVLTDVTTDMVITKEETFGPVAPLYRFKTEAEAIKMANDTEFGLAAYFYSRDIGRIWRVAEALEYGIVGINEGIISTEIAPFGGMKESGIGREGSKYGIEDYLEIKYLCMGGIDR